MKTRLDPEQSVDVDASDDREQHAEGGHADVGEHSRVQQAGDFLEVSGRGVLGNVSDYGGTNAKIEDAGKSR